MKFFEIKQEKNLYSWSLKIKIEDFWKNENKKWRERREKGERTVRWWNTKRGRENSGVPNDRERKEEMQCNKLKNIIKRMQLK